MILYTIARSISFKIIVTASLSLLSIPCWAYTVQDVKTSQQPAVTNQQTEALSRQLNQIVTTLNTFAVTIQRPNEPQITPLNANSVNIQAFLNQVEAKIDFIRNHAAQSAVHQTQLQDKLVNAINDIHTEAAKLPGPVVAQRLQPDGVNIDAVKNDIVTKLLFVRQNNASANNSNNNISSKVKQAVQILNEMRQRLIKIPGIQIIELLPDGDNVVEFLNSFVTQAERITVNPAQFVKIVLAAHHWDELFPNDKFKMPAQFNLQSFLDLYDQFIEVAEHYDEKLKSYDQYSNPILLKNYVSALSFRGQNAIPYGVNDFYPPNRLIEMLTNAINFIDILKEHVSDINTKHQLQILGTKLHIGELGNLAVDNDPVDTNQLNKYLEKIATTLP